MTGSRLIPVGKITRTHGIRGAVKIFPYGETLALQEAGEKLILQSSAGSKVPFLTLRSFKPQGKLLIAEFEELSHIDEAQEVTGQEVFLSEDRLLPTEEGEYYYFQLIGLVVETTQGKRLGVLRGIVETGSNDVYVVQDEGREALIPALDDVIVEVDLQRGCMIIDPPEGLIDDL